MQAARRATQQLLTRNTGNGQMRGFGTHKVDTAYESSQMVLWQRVTLFAGLPICVLYAVKCFSEPHEHHEEKQYPYMKLRYKDFPWGKCDLFDMECKHGGGGH